MNPDSNLNSSLSSSQKGWFVLLAAVLFLLFAGMRFYQLEVRPMHNDEGVNAWFLMREIKSHDYKYDPNNYHGPSLYFIQLIPTWINGLRIEGFKHFSFTSLTGMTDRSIRIGIVLASLLLLLGVLCTRPRLGFWGAFTAFVLLGLSCDFLYFSRYFIHEMYVVLFMMGIYLGATRYLDSGRGKYFYLFILSAVFLFCTKETSIVTYFVMGFSAVCVEFFHRFLRNASSTPVGISLKRDFLWLWDGMFGPHYGSLIFGLIIWFLLYTSFFHNWGGLADSIRTYFKWTHEGVESGHIKPFGYWIRDVLLPYEAAIVVLSVLGGIASILRNDKRGLYLMFWSLGMIAAYSIIPYKTVWCVLNMLLPMALLSGYGVQSTLDFFRDQYSAQQQALSFFFAIGVISLMLFQLPQTLKVVYRDYDKEYYEPPYVHTSRDIYNIIKEIDHWADQDPKGKDITVNVVSDVYWPLPYYLRDYPNVRFWGQYQGIKDLDAPLLLVAKFQEKDLAKLLKARYVRKEFLIRSNTSVVLYINRDVFKNLPSEIAPPSALEPVAVPKSLLPGWMRQTYIDHFCEGDSLSTGLDYSEIDFKWTNEKEKPLYSPFCLAWDGYLQIDQPGEYKFTLDSDDGSQFFLNDQLVVNNEGIHAREKREQTIRLEIGTYKTRLTFFDAGGEAFIRFSWTPPHKPEEIVPPTLFFHTEDAHAR